MTPEQVAYIQRTFAMLVPIQEKAGLLFYNRLFEIAPSVRPLFKDDVSEQAKKLMQVLAIAAKGLSHPDTLVPVVQSLGARHVAYGVKDEHYGPVAEALLWTLEQGLQEAFTPQVKEAWIAAYTLLSTIMKEAADQEAAKAIRAH